MNMIPLVMANEPGRAQHVNLSLLWNCSLECITSVDRRRKSFWKKTSERVRIPSTSETLSVRCVFRVAYFGRGAQNGW